MRRGNFVPFHCSAAVCLLACLAGNVGAAERWTIEATVRDGTRAIVAERTTAAGRSAYTVASAEGAVLAVPAIALDGRGGAAAGWIRHGRGVTDLLVAAFDGRRWGVPVRLQRSTRHLSQPTLAHDGVRGYWVAWTQGTGEGDDIAYTRWDGESVEAVRTLGSPGIPDIDPLLSRNAAGGVRLDWRGFEDGGYRSMSLELAAGNAAGRRGLPEEKETGDLVVGSAARPASSRGGSAWSDGETVVSRPLELESRTSPGPQPVFATAAVGETDLSRILGFGDSTTWGRGSAYNGPPTDYLTRLENSLRGPWTAMNGGHPGYTSADLFDVIDQDLLWRPGLTILMIGVNDAYLRYSYETTYFDVKVLVEKIRLQGGAVILATTTPVIDDAYRMDQYEYLRSVTNPAVRDVAGDITCPLVDVWSHFEGLTDWRSYIYLPHGVHLNDAGNRILAELFRAFLDANDLRIQVGGSDSDFLLADLSMAAYDLPVAGILNAPGNRAARTLVWDTVSPLAADELIAAAPLDLDGDGLDGIAVLADHLGTVSLVVYNAPPAGSFTTEDLLLSVTPQSQAHWLAQVGQCPDGQTRVKRRITHLFGIDQDGDGRDEFGLVFDRSCLDAGGTVLERQVVEIWRAQQPGVLVAQRLVRDEWRLPGNGRIHDATSIQADGDPAQEVLLLTRNSDVTRLHKLPSSYPDFIRLLPDGQYGRYFTCGEDAVPPGMALCDRWANRGQSECGVLVLRSLTPRLLLYDTPPGGADTKEENTEPMLYSWWLEDSSQVAARCVDTGEEWEERAFDPLGVAAADVSLPADGLDEVMLLRLQRGSRRASGVDVLETWGLPSLPAPAGAPPTLVARDQWLRTGQPHQLMVKSGSIPDGVGGTTGAVFFWLNQAR